ncbi:MAG: hypothetical protein ACOC9Q_00345 [bacterium]
MLRSGLGFGNGLAVDKVMQRLWNSGLGLLLVTGALLGLTPPIAKLAVETGIPAMTWAFVVSGGAGGVLTCVQLALRKPVGVTAHKLRYYAIAAAISYAIPNVLIFTAIPHLGAGYTSITFTLSPVITPMRVSNIEVESGTQGRTLGPASGCPKRTLCTPKGEGVGQPTRIIGRGRRSVRRSDEALKNESLTEIRQFRYVTD